jgi:hypothetical protein
MVRRLVIAVLAAVVIAPVYVSAPASAKVLFTCSGWMPGNAGTFVFQPGLMHNPAPQALQYGLAILPNEGPEPCANAQFFTGADYNNGVPTTTYASRPLGCPVALGGAGPDYADQTPIFIGGSNPNSFHAFWGINGETKVSLGGTKIKQGPAYDQLRIQFLITSGQFAPPAGKKTKIKFTVRILFGAQDDEYTCLDNSDPADSVGLHELLGDVIATQK